MFSNKKRLSAFILVSIVAFYHTIAMAQKAEDMSGSGKNTNSLVALPYAFYTPETNIAFGVGSIYSFRPTGSSISNRPSNVKFAATYTQKNQLIMSFIPEIYFNNQTMLFNGFYTYYKYPDKFWGIGNNTGDAAEEDFEPKYLKTFTNIQKKITSNLYIGIRNQVEYLDIIEKEDDGQLANAGIVGSDAGIASGLGIIFNYDSRDNIYYPTSGQYHQIFMVDFDDYFLSDYDFQLVSIDLRRFIQIHNSHVLAFQTYNVFINGEPPFQMLALLGGAYWMRGNYLGRYRDKSMITFQGEYRFPLIWRFGGALFGGIGDVASRVQKFETRHIKYSLGFGIRFMFDSQERINARLDFGLSNDGKSGIYALVLEAF